MCKWLPVVMINATVILLACGAFTQDENLEYAFGKVIKVNTIMNEITIVERDLYDGSGKSNRVTYSVDSDTKIYFVDTDFEFEDEISLWDIKKGNFAKIDYIPGEYDNRTARFIHVYTRKTAGSMRR